MIQSPEVEENPTRLPGTCFSCGGGKGTAGRTWFLDTDIDYFDTPMYRIQICNICFDLLANTCGYIKIGEEVDQYKVRIANLEEEINGLNQYRRVSDLLGLDSDRINRLLSLSEVPLGEGDDDSVNTGAKKRSGTKGNSGSVGGGETGLPKQVDDERVDVIRPTNKPVRVNI